MEGGIPSGGRRPGSQHLRPPPRSFRGARLESERSLREILVATDALDELSSAQLMGILGTALPPK